MLDEYDADLGDSESLCRPIGEYVVICVFLCARVTMSGQLVNMLLYVSSSVQESLCRPIGEYVVMCLLQCNGAIGKHVIICFFYYVGGGCMTFGVVIRAPVPNGRMSDPFPCGSWPYHSVPDGLRGIWYSSSGSFALRVSVGLRLNSSLYISGSTSQAGALRSFFLCGTIPGREGIP
nr:orf116 [Ipomoea batatas]